MDKELRRAWHGSGADLEFEPGDFEIIDLVLGQVPELRICASALKKARSKHLKYPLRDHDALASLLDGKEFKGGGHHFGSQDVQRFVPADFLPIHNEAELVRSLYIALVRCRHEEAMKASASPDILRHQHVGPTEGQS